MSEEAGNVARWLPAAHAGSAEALGQALEACRGYLLMIARRELDADLQAKGGASDLVQETFLKAHRHFDQFHGATEAELLAWLRRLLLNNLADFRAWFRTADKRTIAREVDLGGVGSTSNGPGEPAAADPSPSGMAIERERAEAVHRLLEKLPEDYRRVLLLRHQEDATFEEIGRRMQRSADAARKLWARAVERVEREWEAETVP
jgi:RNA polymerase sigma-70 factor (ECF subfamily)